MKLPPSEKPARYSRACGQLLLERAHAPRHVSQATAMKHLAVEMMRGAVIAQVQPHDAEAVLPQQRGERQHVARVGTALPAVQQQRELRPWRVRGRMEGLQPHPLAAVEQQLCEAASSAAARWRTGRVRGGNPPRIDCRWPLASRPRNLGSWDVMAVRWSGFRRRGSPRGYPEETSSRQGAACQCTSTRLLAAAARFHSPALSMSLTGG